MIAEKLQMVLSFNTLWYCLDFVDIFNNIYEIFKKLLIKLLNR